MQLKAYAIVEMHLKRALLTILEFELNVVWIEEIALGSNHYLSHMYTYNLLLFAMKKYSRGSWLRGSAVLIQRFGG